MKQLRGIHNYVAHLHITFLFSMSSSAEFHTMIPSSESHVLSVKLTFCSRLLAEFFLFLSAVVPALHEAVHRMRIWYYKTEYTLHGSDKHEIKDGN
jgi:hypothetical protein